MARFWRRRKDTVVVKAFRHEDWCKYSDVDPEWVADPPMGVERRQCVCGAESRPLLTNKLDPRTQSPRPALSAVPHHPGCERADAAVMVEPNVRDGGWSSRCAACTASGYFWREDVWEERGPGRDPVRVSRAGNIFYQYESA